MTTRPLSVPRPGPPHRPAAPVPQPLGCYTFCLPPPLEESSWDEKELLLSQACSHGPQAEIHTDARTQPQALSLQPCPFPVTLTISNAWEISNLTHLKSQGAQLAPKSLFQRWETGAQGRTVTDPRLLGVFVKAKLHPGLCSPSPIPIHPVALALPGVRTSSAVGLLLPPGGSFAVSTLQQPPRRHLEARKCWRVDLQGGWQALLTLGTAQRSPFTCAVANRRKRKGRSKPLLMRTLTHQILHLAAASSRKPSSPGKNSLLHKSHTVPD